MEDNYRICGAWIQEGGVKRWVKDDFGVFVRQLGRVFRYSQGNLGSLVEQIVQIFK